MVEGLVVLLSCLVGAGLTLHAGEAGWCSIEYASAREQVNDPHSAEKKKNHIVEVMI
jgi:hypothetical protein